MEKVSAVKCESYKTEEVYQAVKEAIENIGFVIPENKTVLIKPNIMSQNRPEQHTVTHFSVIEALCKILTEYNCKIQIGESISFYEEGLTKKAFKISGIEEVALKYGASLIPFEQTPLTEVDSGLLWIDKLYIPTVLLEADMVIDACKLKTHGSLRLSGAVKNMFGCLPGGYKQKMHRWSNNELELSDLFLNLHEIIKPALSVMDAVVSLDGGPTALGTPVKTSKIFASENAAALDVIASRMIGYSLDESPILVQAKNRGFIKNFEDIDVVGEVNTFDFKKPVTADLEKLSNKNGILVKDTYVDLTVKAELCNNCRKCVENCPVMAIKETLDKPFIDTEDCINCYYCMHICPKGAIKTKATATNIIIRGLRKIARI